VVLKALGRDCSRRAGHIVGWPRLVTQPPGASARNPHFFLLPRGGSPMSRKWREDRRLAFL